MQDDIQIIREALAAGPTPGPWQHMNFSSGAAVTAFAGGYDERGPSIAETGGSRSFVVGPGVGKPDAAYIAACSPDRMERLLARLEAAESRAAALTVAMRTVRQVAFVDGATFQLNRPRATMTDLLFEAAKEGAAP